MVMVLAAHAAATPAGKPIAAPMPVARVVVCVIFVSAVFIHKVGVEEPAVTVISGVTVIFTALVGDEHGPDVTILRNHVVAVSAGGAYPTLVVPAPPILVNVTLSGEDCHLYV